MRMKLATAAAIAVTLPLTACFSTTSGTAEPGTGPAGAASATTQQPASDTDKSAPKIGDSYKYDDGVAVEITKTKRGKAGKYAAGAKPGAPTATVTVRVTNKSAQNMNADLVNVTLSYGPDGEQAERVFDSDTGLGLTGTIAKGKAKSGDYVFGVPTKYMSDVMVEVTPGFEYEPVVFSGKIR